MRIVRNSVWTGLLLMVAHAGFALAQNATGSIHGSVSDEQRSMISGAAVAITNKATGNTRNVTTSPEGADTAALPATTLPSSFVWKRQALPLFSGKFNPPSFNHYVDAKGNFTGQTGCRFEEDGC